MFSSGYIYCFCQMFQEPTSISITDSKSSLIFEVIIFLVCVFVTKLKDKFYSIFKSLHTLHVFMNGCNMFRNTLPLSKLFVANFALCFFLSWTDETCLFIKPFQNKKDQNNLRYPAKKQSFSKERLLFCQLPQILLALLILKRL